MHTPTKFPAFAAIAVRIPRPAISASFVFRARRNGPAVTETMRLASPILISHNPCGYSATPGALLVLTGPAGPSIPRGPGTSEPSGPGWNDPGQDRSGLWLRNAAAGLCVLAAAAAAVSFTAFGGLRYRNCLTAVRAGVGRGLAVSGLAGCGG